MPAVIAKPSTHNARNPTSSVAAEFKDLPIDETYSLGTSPIHEHRLCALVILVNRFEKSKDEKVRKTIFDTWMKLLGEGHINNWDLVDTSAPHIVGAWLLKHDREILRTLAKSTNLWERRIAVLATQAFIRNRQFDDTLEIVSSLLNDPHDLMHKACGWMLRELGKQDLGALREFLDENVYKMPRTMLRYAIEKMSERERKEWLKR